MEAIENIITYSNDCFIKRFNYEELADINAKNNEGYTPLILYSGEGNLEIVKYLV